jgi:pseudouridine-5'-phosphate glycosidase
MLRFRSLYTYHTSKSVQDALLKKRPVVALESTIITHGMPYPANLQTAREIESIVKSYGCTPATIAILNGEIKVGLSDAELVTLATSQNVVKTSRRDLAWVVSQKLNGSTTVSATMIAADKVGIPIFVTGGIGGVHRDFENAFDVSADLTELGRTSVAVVCAGVKSILDIEKTLEYLETMGVTVVSYGDSDNFPAFFTSKSGFKSMANSSSISNIAEMIRFFG